MILEKIKPQGGEATEKPSYTAKDYSSGADVRWCPGCGDYSILANVQRVMPDLGVPREDVVFGSGIGCGSGSGAGKGSGVTSGTSGVSGSPATSST